MQAQRATGPGSQAGNPLTVQEASRVAQAASEVAKHAANPTEESWHNYSWGPRTTARAIKHAAAFAKLIKKPKDAAYWVKLIEKAIADENKLQKEATCMLIS